MDNRIVKSLGGHKLRINWRSPKKLDEVRELASKMYDDVSEADSPEASNEILETYYKDSAGIMFEFEYELPEDFWSYEDFPQGEFEVLQQLFMNPTKAM